MDSPHYLQIDMGAGNAVSDFYFNYSLRENNYHTVPTEIIVSGSNDGVNFDEITVIGRDELLGMEIADNVVYELNSNFATATKNARQLSAIKLLSPGCGEQTVQITDKNRIYNDMTSSTLDVIAEFQDIYRFIVTEFVPCIGITILQCFTHLLITANVSIGKC